MTVYEFLNACCDTGDQQAEVFDLHRQDTVAHGYIDDILHGEYDDMEVMSWDARIANNNVVVVCVNIDSCEV